ncbi:MAG: hypothetical protein KF763_18420 [Cyclobacteriaceae bacterium]|nr:hypothetical protein [Cyclobacteriaceae bacterium]
MKKTLSLLFFLVAISAMVVMQSCDGDDPKPATIPTISLSSTTGQGNPGSTVTVTATIAASGGASELIVAGVTSTPASPISLSGTALTQEVGLQVPASAVVGSTINVVLTVKDNGGLVSIPATFTITVQDPTIVLSGNLTTQTLDASKKYLIRGQTFIKDGITVTIPAGTVLFGEKSTKGTLIVERGGKLLCNGTATSPVVMTSNQGVNERDKGDWGGLVILGKAYTNQPNPAVEGISPAVNFGADNRTNDNDNSGVYKYLRVEYAGIELTPNNETNSITLGSVGSGTEFHHVQVSFGGDDGFEWFGGTVNAKHLISLSTWDDDFDCDYGWSGNVQFALVVRNPFSADQSQSNAFENDNGPNDNDTGAGTYTTGTFSNVTVYGPIDRTGRANSANNVHSIDLRRRNATSIFNSVIGGFPTGLRMNQNSVYSQYTAATPNGVLANNILIAPAATRFAIGSGVTFTATDLQTYWDAANTSLAIPANDDNQTSFYTTLGLRIDNFFARYTGGASTYPSDPDFTISSGTATIATGASFTNAKFSEAGRTGFFENVAYRGAFGTTDWTNGWAEFRPITKVY